MIHDIAITINADEHNIVILLLRLIFKHCHCLERKYTNNVKQLVLFSN